MPAAWRMGLLSVLLLAAPRVADAQTQRHGHRLERRPARARATPSNRGASRARRSIRPTRRRRGDLDAAADPHRCRARARAPRRASAPSTRTPIPTRPARRRDCRPRTRTETRIRTATTVTPDFDAGRRAPAPRRGPRRADAARSTRPPTYAHAGRRRRRRRPRSVVRHRPDRPRRGGGLPPAQKLASALVDLPLHRRPGRPPTRASS